MKPKKVLTQYQKDFIKNNYLSMSFKDISAHTGLSENFLWAYRKEENLAKKKNRIKPTGQFLDGGEYFNVDAKTNWAIG